MSNRQALRFTLKKKFKLFTAEFAQYKKLPFAKFVELHRLGAIDEILASKKKTTEEVILSTPDTSEINDMFVSDTELFDE